MIQELLNIIDNTVKAGYGVADRPTIARWFDYSDQDLTATINTALKQGLITKSGNIYSLTSEGAKKVSR
jgi:predicted transcriptional regulator